MQLSKMSGRDERVADARTRKMGVTKLPDHTIRSTKGMHWFVPMLLLSSLIVGVLLAVGHHLFYASLDKTAVPTGGFNLGQAEISQQQLNIGAGTAFAFIVKAALTIAISTAYCQFFWHALRTAKSGTELSSVDAMFSALENILSMVKLTIWYKHPWLFLLAIVTWCVPIASIITPGTLSVQNIQIIPPPTRMATVPNLEFTSLDFTAPFDATHNQSQYCYTRPSQKVERVAASVSSQGLTLPILSTAVNESWSLQFHAPTLQCSNVTEQQHLEISQNIIKYLMQHNQTARTESCNDSPGFLAWLGANASVLPYGPTVDKLNHTDLAFRENGLNVGDTMAINIAIMPSIWNSTLNLPTHDVSGGCAMVTTSTSEQAVAKLKADIFTCRVFNASHTADFSFINGAQTVDYSVHELGEAVTYSRCITGPVSGSNGGSDLDFDLGKVEAKNSSCSTFNDIGQQCVFQPELVRQLSYQGISLAIFNTIVGWIGLDDPNEFYPSPYYTSDLMPNTVLMDTKDLAFIRNWHIFGTHNDLSTKIQYSNWTGFRGILSDTTTGTRGSLRTLMVDLFKNYTISLMSESDLLPNYTSPYAPEPLTKLSTVAFHNVYVYAPRTLWLAYGVAIGFAFLAVASGLIIILINDATYDNSFSSILRVSRTGRLGEEVACEDDGRKPLPHSLKEARFNLTIVAKDTHLSSPEDDEEASQEKQASETANSLLELIYQKMIY